MVVASAHSVREQPKRVLCSARFVDIVDMRGRFVFCVRAEGSFGGGNACRRGFGSAARGISRTSQVEVVAGNRLVREKVGEEHQYVSVLLNDKKIHRRTGEVYGQFVRSRVFAFGWWGSICT